MIAWEDGSPITWYDAFINLVICAVLVGFCFLVASCAQKILHRPECAPATRCGCWEQASHEGKAGWIYWPASNPWCEVKR